MIMLTEVYKKPSGTGEREYSLRQVLVNPQQVMLLREDKKIEDSFRKGQLPADLDERQEFTRLHLSSMNNNSITVVGNMTVVCKKLLGG
tara:strand:- start:685 stop:951 length:267 start_codon:yes stop_codon:yes gene_type:complete